MNLRIPIALLACWLSLAPLGAADAAWRTVSTGELTLITDLNEARAVARAREFAQYVAALRSYFGNPAGRLAPLTMVVFARSGDFDRYRPLGKNGRPQDVAGFFVRHESWAVIGLADKARDEARHVVFHEGVHWFLNGSENWMPPWLDEGMAEVFSTFEIVDNSVRWGRELKGRTQLLHHYGTLPLRELMFMSRSDLFTGDAARTSVFYAQSWAFVHFLMFGENKMPRDAARQYVALMAAGKDPDDAFSAAFGRSYGDMDRLLSRYLNGPGRYRVSRRPLVPVPAVRVEAATPGDVDEALGRLALVGNRIELATQHGRAMLARQQDNPRGHSLLGMAFMESGRKSEAVSEFELAAQYGSSDFRPYFEVALALQNESIGMGSTMSGDAARRAADYYLRAIALHPSFETSYENLAGLAGLAEPIRDGDPSTLIEGARLFPRNQMIQLGIAQLARRAGNPAQGREILERVLAHSGDLSPGELGYAQRICEAWDDEDLLNRVDALTADARFDDALALLDRRLAEGVRGDMHRQFSSLRRQVQTAAAIHRLNIALRQDAWAVARQVIADILNSDAPNSTKSNVRRILAQLDERGLGAEQKSGGAVER